MSKSGTIRAGIGGWTFAPWEGTFYPDKLAKAKQLAFAASKLKTIEVNGTYYSGFTPATYAKWAAETPDGFVFSIKGNRFVTNRKVLAEAGESMKKFFAQGLEELGPKLGPLVWQFANTKKFEPDDFEAFLRLLPPEHAGLQTAPCRGGPPSELRRAGVSRAVRQIWHRHLSCRSRRLSGNWRCDGRLCLFAAAKGQ